MFKNYKYLWYYNNSGLDIIIHLNHHKKIFFRLNIELSDNRCREIYISAKTVCFITEYSQW